MARFPFKGELRQLPLRAILALVSRCARRVRPILGCEEEEEGKRLVFDAAVRAAEDYAAGAVSVPDLSRETFNLARQDDKDHHLVLTVAALVAQAATQAVGAGIFHGPVVTENPFLGDSIEPSMADVMLTSASEAVLFYSSSLPYAEEQSDNDPSWVDYEHLLAANLGKFPDPGQHVDPSETGPLGALWPAGAPRWLQWF